MKTSGLLEFLGSQILKILPIAGRDALLAGAVRRSLKGLDDSDALKFLFRLDNRLYKLHGRLAKAIGNGSHLKHEIIRHEEFFCKHVNKGDRILDVGCGNGRIAYAVASETDARVTAIDLSSKKLDLARKLHLDERITYIEGDVLKDFPEHKYDVVILSNVLEHLKPRVEFMRHLRDVTGAARYLVRVPVFDRDWRVAAKKELGIDWRLDPTHEIEYTEASFEKEVSAAGLDIVYLKICWGEIRAKLSC